MHTLGIIDLVVWLMVVELLAFASFPLLARALPQAADRGLGISKIFGLFALGLPAWLIPTLTGQHVTTLFVTALFAPLIVWGFVQYSKPEVWALLRSLKAHVICTEILFLGLTTLFGVIRLLNPEIFWGEKPMDSTFLHFFTRNEVLPPQDPWAAGNPMSYYYLGIYFISMLLKLTGIAPSVGYNLAMATLAGLIGSALYTVLLFFIRSRWVAVAAASFVVLSTSPEVLSLTFIDGRTPNFDTFWASSRVFVSPGFFEYTSWSLLFADLHAHVVAIPFTVLVVALALYTSRSPGERYTFGGFLARAMLGLSLGALFGLNTWDFLTFGLLTGVLFLTSPAPRFWVPPSRPDGSVSIGERAFATLFARVVAYVWDAGVVGVTARAVSWLFERETFVKRKAAWGWVTGGEFNSILHVSRAIGYFIVVVAVVIVAVLVQRALVRRAVPKWYTVLGALAVGCVMALPAIASVQAGMSSHSWWLIGYSVAVALFGFIALWSPATDQRARTTFLFISIPLFLVLMLEHFYLFDRMNTLFKGYMAVWMIGSIGVVAFVGRFSEGLWSSGSVRTRVVIAAGVGLVVAANLLGSALNIYGIVNTKRVPERVYTLDGAAYLRSMAPEDYEIISWFNQKIGGTPTIIEAQGESYREYTRISMHTGLPAVLGWEYHVQQRGLAGWDLQARKQAVQDLYSDPSRGLTHRILDKYKVDFVVFGAVERAKYGEESGRKLDEIPETLRRVASFGASHIYVATRSPFYKLLVSE